MDREFAALRRGYRDERRRAADDPRTDPEQDGGCPFGWAWCDPSADLDDGDGFTCFRCYVRQDREDGGPYPAVDPAGGESGDE